MYRLDHCAVELRPGFALWPLVSQDLHAHREIVGDEANQRWKNGTCSFPMHPRTKPHSARSPLRRLSLLLVSESALVRQLRTETGTA